MLVGGRRESYHFLSKKPKKGLRGGPSPRVEKLSHKRKNLKRKLARIGTCRPLHLRRVGKKRYWGGNKLCSGEKP